MVAKSLLVALALSSAASASFGSHLLPHCWNKCAVNTGLTCDWTDLSCICKAANDGMIIRANTCACSSCDDKNFSHDGVLKVQLKELETACKIIRLPFARPAVEAVSKAGVCDAGPPPSPGSAPPIPPPSQPVPSSTEHTSSATPQSNSSSKGSSNKQNGYQGVAPGMKETGWAAAMLTLGALIAFGFA